MVDLFQCTEWPNNNFSFGCYEIFMKFFSYSSSFDFYLSLRSVSFTSFLRTCSTCVTHYSVSYQDTFVSSAARAHKCFLRALRPSHLTHPPCEDNRGPLWSLLCVCAFWCVTRARPLGSMVFMGLRSMWNNPARFQVPNNRPSSWKTPWVKVENAEGLST